jgi:hypothetical protein
MLISLSSQLHTPPAATNTQHTHGFFARIFFAMSRSGISNFDTLKKARIKGAEEYMDAKNIPYSHNDLFRFHDVSKEQGWAILKDESMAADRTHHNSELTPEKRGRKPLLSPKQVREADRFLQDVGWDARVLTWDQLANELDFGVSGWT